MENKILGMLLCGLPTFFWWCEFHFAGLGARNAVDTFLRMDVNSVGIMTVGVFLGCASYKALRWLPRYF